MGSSSSSSSSSDKTVAEPGKVVDKHLDRHQSIAIPDVDYSKVTAIFTVNDVYIVDNFPKFQTFVEQRLAERKYGQIFKTLPGDFLSPSPMTPVDHGTHVIDIMNELKFDYICVGNHEFDIGRAALEKQLKRFQGKTLNSNIANLQNTIPFDITTTPTGKKVGWFATCTDDTVRMIPPAKLEPVVFSPHQQANSEMAKKLKEEHQCDLVVALTHQWIREDRDLLETCPDVDVVIGGHDHTAYVEQREGRWLVKVGADATHVGVIELIDLEQQSPAAVANLLTAAPAAAPAAAAAAVAPVSEPPLETGAVSSEAAAAPAAAEKRNLLLQAEKLPLTHLAPAASIQVRVEAVKRQLADLAGICLYPKGDGPLLSSRDSRAKVCTLGTLFATITRSYLHADCCLFGGGAIRGNRTYDDGFCVGQLEGELPFPNHMVVFEVKGQLLHDMMKHSRTFNYPNYGAYFQYDDKFNYDEEKHEINSINGQPFDLSKTYRLATLAQYAAGLDTVTPMTEAVERGEIYAFAQEALHEINIFRHELLCAMVASRWTFLFGVDALKAIHDYDRDGDGTLDVQELAKATHPLLVAAIMAVADIDKDKHIDVKEMAAAIQRASESMAGNAAVGAPPAPTPAVAAPAAVAETPAAAPAAVAATA